MRADSIRNSLLVGLFCLLAACSNSASSEAPTDSTEVEQRAIYAQTPDLQTGAEIQMSLPDRVVRAIYVCINAERLTVDFDNPRDMATVRSSGGLAIDLHRQDSETGLLYIASGYELLSQGNDATWTSPDKEPTRCRAVD